MKIDVIDMVIGRFLDQGLNTNQKSLPRFQDGSQATQASYKDKVED